MALTKSAKIAWTGEELNFAGTLDSGFPVSMKGTADEEGGSPMSVLLSGVAGCTAMDVLSIVQKKRQQVDRFEVEIVGQRAETHPMVYTEVDITYIFYGNVTPAAAERAIELSQTKYCSASVIFARAGVEIRTHYEIREE
ncbi:MAG: OsmC family protein [Candidatus Promineifilaceae bacterium]